MFGLITPLVLWALTGLLIANAPRPDHQQRPQEEEVRPATSDPAAAEQEENDADECDLIDSGIPEVPNSTRTEAGYESDASINTLAYQKIDTALLASRDAEEMIPLIGLPSLMTSLPPTRPNTPEVHQLQALELGDGFTFLPLLHPDTPSSMRQGSDVARLLRTVNHCPGCICAPAMGIARFLSSQPSVAESSSGRAHTAHLSTSSEPSTFRESALDEREPPLATSSELGQRSSTQDHSMYPRMQAASALTSNSIGQRLQARRKMRENTRSRILPCRPQVQSPPRKTRVDPANEGIKEYGYASGSRNLTPNGPSASSAVLHVTNPDEPSDHGDADGWVILPQSPERT